MEDMLDRFKTPSPQGLSPTQFLNRLASPTAPSSIRAPSAVSLDSPSPPARKSPFVPESVSPMPLHVESPEILEDISSTVPPNVDSACEDILLRFIAIEKRLTTLESNNTALLIENKRLEAQCKRLKNEVNSAMKAAQDACQKASKQCNCVSSSSHVDLPSNPQPAPTIVPKKSYSRVLQEKASVNSASSTDVPLLPPVQEPVPALQADIPPVTVAPSTSIPATYAGKILTRIMNTSKATANTEKGHRPDNAENTNQETQLNSTAAPIQRRTYKPPANLPPVATWTVLYLEQVPWTPISNIRKTLKACNIQLSKIVNLAWRKGKVLEVILDQNIASPFAAYVERNLNWIQTDYKIVPDDSTSSDSLLFNKPPVHVAIMSFFAAIKRQAPTYDVAYFLKNHAISLLSDFSDAPFEELWESAGHLMNASSEEASTSA